MIRVGFLWETPFKAGERHIRRHVLGSRRFEPVVLGRRVEEDRARLPARVVRLDAGRSLWIKLHRKYVLRAPRCVYNQEVDALVRAVRELDLRLLHVFFGTKAIKNLVALRLAGVPVTVSFHGVDVGDCVRKPELSRHLAELFDTAAAILPRSRFMADRLRELGCPEEKLWIHRAGIPLGGFPYRERHRLVDDPIVFLQVCRLIAKKGLQDTLAAFDRTRRGLPRAELWIAGEGRLRAELEDEIARRELGAQVRLLGMLDPPQLLERLQAAHVFVHPSVTTDSGDQEGIPNSMLEAMATGLPAVATQHAGIPEAIEDGVSGWLVAERDPEQLAARMAWCARHPDDVARAGAAARRAVERDYDLDLRMRLLDEKYAELIEAYQPPQREPIGAALRRLDLAAYRG